MKLIGIFLVGMSTLLWASQSKVTYRDTVATPKQSVVAMEILAEGMQSLDKSAVKVQKKNGKITITIDEAKVANINAEVGKISHTTTGKERQDNKAQYKDYITYVNKVSKAQHYIKGNRKKVSDVKAQVCINLHLVDQPSYDIEIDELAEYRWENEINAVDIVDTLSYSGDIELAAEILSRNTEVLEDDEYFYVHKVRVENGKLKMDSYYFDDEDSPETWVIPKVDKPCSEQIVNN